MDENEKKEYTKKGSTVDGFIELLSPKGEKVYIRKSQLRDAENVPNDKLNWNEIKNNVVKVRNIVSGEKKSLNFITPHYVIPSYQRGYRWESKHVQEFIDDIMNNYRFNYSELKEGNDRADLNYCLQPIVLKRYKLEKGKTFVANFEVIDGQQRLTTLALIYKALAKLCGKAELRISISYKTRNSEKFLENMQEPSDDSDIDHLFMWKTYILARDKFKKIVTEPDINKSWFSFTNSEKLPGEDYTMERIYKLWEIFSSYVDVIWYEIPDESDADEYTTFENFNSGKIPLTKSELIKALFMNPSNYLSSAATSDTFDAIKIRQFMLGAQWDEMERLLYNPDFWHFIPHMPNHTGTRLDTIFNLFIYIEDTKAFNMDDPIYAYRRFNEIISEALEALKAQSECSEAELMQSQWEKFHAFYTDLKEWFDDETLDAKPSTYGLFHRICLYQYLKTVYYRQVTKKGPIEEYKEKMNTIATVWSKLNKCAKSERNNEMNKLILAALKEIYNSKICKTVVDIESRKELWKGVNLTPQVIKSLTYGTSNRMIQAVLLIFNLAVMEEATNSLSRFPFRFFEEDNDWVSEHIFARGTNLSGLKDDEKLALLKEINFEEMEQYLISLYQDNSDANTPPVFDAKFNELLMLKKQQFDILDKIRNAPITNDTNSSLDIVFKPVYDDSSEVDVKSLYVKFFTDDSMGNMALLTRKDNSSVNNKDYENKSEIIEDRISQGNFVPVCTMNVFYGAYSQKGNNKQWLPKQRKSYLEKMCKYVCKYLEFKNRDGGSI